MSNPRWCDCIPRQPDSICRIQTSASSYSQVVTGGYNIALYVPQFQEIMCGSVCVCLTINGVTEYRGSQIRSAGFQQ